MMKISAEKLILINFLQLIIWTGALSSLGMI